MSTTPNGDVSQPTWSRSLMAAVALTDFLLHMQQKVVMGATASGLCVGQISLGLLVDWKKPTSD